jgi:hypothetical protein
MRRPRPGAPGARGGNGGHFVARGRQADSNNTLGRTCVSGGAISGRAEPSPDVRQRVLENPGAILGGGSYLFSGRVHLAPRGASASFRNKPGYSKH